MTTPNRRNSDFQIAYLLAGNRHTPDAAYLMLCNLLEERELSLEEAEPHVKKFEDMLKNNWQNKILNKFKPKQAVAAKTFLRNYKATKKEIETIKKCIERVQPFRKYSHLPDDEAHEACQREEWKLEFIARAENSLLASGTIPSDQLSAMRSHPDFVSQIWPAVEKAKELIVKGDATKLLESQHGLIGLNND